MLTVSIACLVLLALTTVIHYEVLRGLSSVLPQLRIASRAKLILVIFATFFAHASEMLLYGLTAYSLATFAHVGATTGHGPPVLSQYLYFSAETYTSLGFGDILPGGPLRLLAGVETLNGLLLIGWSASYIYLAMERFWEADNEKEHSLAADAGATPSRDRRHRRQSSTRR